MENSPNVQFGKALRKKRKDLGLTQEELADRCLLDPSYISLLERDRKKPGLNTIIILSRCFEIKPSEFFKEIEDDPENNWLKDIGLTTAPSTQPST
ncbi:helix-turn-helix domain-containing protein [Neobacillus sp. Marseille-QA0830]